MSEIRAIKSQPFPRGAQLLTRAEKRAFRIHTSTPVSDPNKVFRDVYAPPPLLNLVVIRSADLDRAERFYRVLGLHFERHRHGSGPEHLAAQPHAGGYVFEIYLASAKAGSTTGVRIGFNMDAVDTYIDGLVEAGGAIIQAPVDSEWGRRAVVADPDGHRVELVTPPDRAANLSSQQVGDAGA